MQLARLGPLVLALVSASQSTCRGPAGGGQAPAGSAAGAAPSGEVEIAGVDTSALTPRERREWSTYVSELLAPCPGAPVSIAACVKEKRACGTCLPAAKLLYKQVRDGRTRAQAEDSFYARFGADKVQTVDVSDTPMRGAPLAPVSVVEFADFECPHCRMMAPMLEKLVDQFPGQVKFYFKTYPLPMHPRAEPAARAAVAAGVQGKFWEMHHALFEHQGAFEGRDLEKYAKEIGLDVSKWKSDFDAPSTADRVAKDRKLGEQLKLTGTPTIYINGRLYEGQDELNDWIALEIELATGKPATQVNVPAASAAASAAKAPEKKP